MATRYWVGGSGTWDTSTTTNWSATSGGTGGASAPTSTDDVVFNALSGTTYTVTIANSTSYCNNLTVTRPSGTVSFVTSGVVQITAIYGSITLLSNLGISLGSLNIYLSGSGTNNTITLYGISAASTSITVNADTSTAKWSFLDTATTLSLLTMQGYGIINLNSKTLTLVAFRPGSSPGNFVRQFIFGNSGQLIVTGTGTQAFDNTYPTGLTVTSDANASISLTSASSKTFKGGGMSWPGLRLNGITTITGSNTFGGAYSQINAGATVLLTAGTTQTFTSALYMQGQIGSSISISSVTVGTQATISQASGLALNARYLTLQDINATGGQTWAAANSVDSGNNTGWTFTTVTTRFWVGGSGTWNTTATANWSATSGGAGGASAPTSTDDVVFDTASGTTYTVTVSDSTSYCNNIAVTKPSGTITFAYSGVIRQNFISGSVFLLSTSGITFNLANIYFTGSNTSNTINLNGNTGANGLWTFHGSTNTTRWLMLGTMVTSITLSLSKGIIDLNSKSLTLQQFWPGEFSVATRQFIFGQDGSLIITGSGASIFDCSYPANLTVTSGTNARISLTSSSAKTIKGGSLSWPALSLVGITTITGSNSFGGAYSEFGPGSTTYFTAGTTQTFTSGLYIQGSTSNSAVLNSTVAGTQATISQAAGLLLDVQYATIKDSNAVGGQTWYATNSTDGGNNSGWLFPAVSRGSMMLFF